MVRPDERSSDRRRLALIIGNNEYSQQKNKLSDPMKNAKNLSDLLKTIGFDITLEENIHGNMMKQIKIFAKKTRKNDLVLFYYSGQCRQINNRNYLIPVDDANIEMDSIQEFGTNADRVLERLVERNIVDHAPSYTTIFILDCCRPYELKNESISGGK
jgi:uncharacterized caspase-like protein